MKRSVIALVALGFAAAPALSQTTAPTTKQPTAPAQAPTTTAPGATTTTPGATTATPGTATTADRWYSVKTDDLRASKLIGTNVRNAAGDTIGEINEVMIDKSGRVAAVVVGVGGFLGIGEREVAMNYSALQMRMDANGNLTITTNATKEDLTSAPALNRSTTTAK